MRAATGRLAGELHHLRARASCEFASLKALGGIEK
jgi:hypothetical protein